MSNKPGGGDGSTATRPKATEMTDVAQKQKSLTHKLNIEISNIVENFSHFVYVSMVNDPPVRNSQDCFQIEVCATRMTQAADPLLKLVSELKHTAILSSFAVLNDNVDRRIAVFNREEEWTDSLLERIREEVVESLEELESHYYGSVMRRVVEAELCCLIRDFFHNLIASRFHIHGHDTMWHE